MDVDEIKRKTMKLKKRADRIKRFVSKQDASRAAEEATNELERIEQEIRSIDWSGVDDKISDIWLVVKNRPEDVDDEDIRGLMHALEDVSEALDKASRRVADFMEGVDGILSYLY